MSILNKKTKIALVVTAFAASGSAFAENPAVAKINEAIANGEAMVQLTTGGLISVAAICFGVGLVAAMLIKR
ncbi:TPA: hypothetical protein ACVU5L_002710 [Vibrio parahaemolyticus]